MTHPSLDDVRSAVEAGKKHIGTPDFMYPLVALGESYLEVEGLPEEKVIPANSDWVSEPYKSGFNSALSLCRLAYLKQAKRVEDAEAREKWFDSLVEYKIKGKFSSLRAYIEHLEKHLSQVKPVTEEMIRKIVNPKRKE